MYFVHLLHLYVIYICNICAMWFVPNSASVIKLEEVKNLAMGEEGGDGQDGVKKWEREERLKRWTSVIVHGV